jgi:DNA-binding CsgD family transcriptional regulator
MNRPFPEHLVAVVSDRVQISKLSVSLLNTAHKDWMTLNNLVTEVPLTEEAAQAPQSTFSHRVRCRSIYAAAAMDDPVARQVIEAYSDAGEQARLLPEVPMKMKLADRTTALLPLTSTGMAGVLVIRAPVIIAALRDYFELLWERATPLSAEGSSVANGRPTPMQQAILSLMAVGLSDEAIARRTGLNTTTVRQHITAIMRRLRVASRFAAGAAAQRCGWIG